MKSILAAAILLILPSAAFAQTPAFLPFTVTQQDATNLENYLNDNVPPRYGNPIYQWLRTLEANAQAAAAKAKALPKSAEKPAEKPIAPPAKK